MQKYFYKTTVAIEVLSDAELVGLTLGQIAEQIAQGDFSGGELRLQCQPLTPMQMATALEEQGSDRDFLLGENTRVDLPHCQITYDENYSGGNYSGTGQTVRISWEVIDQDFGEDVEAAFEWWTGLDPIHIVHYSNEEFDSDGKPYED